MTIYNFRRRSLAAGPIFLVAVMLALGPAQASLSNTIRIVLQKGRHYDPGDLFLHRGDSITLVNGDERAVHHAFIEADQFAFDPAIRSQASRQP